MRQYFDANGIKYKDVAEKIHVTRGAISNILAGRDAIGKDRAKRLSDVYGFDYRFLLTGEGELFPPKVGIHQNISGSHNVQVAEVKTKGCPSVEELMNKIEQLERSVADKDKEVTFLRDMLDRLIPGRKLQDTSE